MGKRGPKAGTTQANVDAFVKGIEDGLSTTGAAGMAGVPRTTMLQWIARGEKLELELDGKSPRDPVDALQVELAQRIRTAAAKIERELVITIRGAARGAMKGDWRAASWILERRYPREWCRLIGEAKREAVDIMLETLRELLSEAEYERVRRSLARASVQG